jgi:PAS domain S-box-containing protein
MPEKTKRDRRAMQQNNRAPDTWTPAQAALIELAHDAILVRDPDSAVIFWNHGAEELYGWTAEAALGQVTHTLLQTQFPESCAVVDEALARIGQWEGELIHTCENGNRVVVESRQVLVRDEVGNPHLILEVNRDITARKAEEEQVARSSEALRQLNIELQRSNQELQDFASVASHDLQEPLRKIQAFGNLLQEEYSAILGEGNEYLTRMHQAATRMRTLIDDLLTFSRVTTHALPFAPVNLSIIAYEVVNDLEAQIAVTQGTVEIGELPTLEADPMQMRQLLQNLIGNALKFHRKEDFPVVVVRAEQVNDAQPEAEPEQVWRLLVADNGIGFDEKYLDRIFTVFQRLHGKRSYEGTGIGLAVVRKIVERHGGRITAKSTPGQGSTFIVTLPVVQSISQGEKSNGNERFADHLDGG